jgi:hypothetical protein
MWHRKPKRYTVARSGDGYEVLDTDAAGARVYFSGSHKSAGEMSRQLIHAQDNTEKPPDPWAGGNFGGAGGG